MRALRLTILFTLFLSLCPSPLRAELERKSGRPIRDKWAVVIGIDKFKDSRIPTLRYSAKDARDFANFLVAEGNFEKNHVLTLINEQATENNIQTVIGDDWLPRRVLSDDVVLIYASTHGSPKEMDVAHSNFLIAHDTNIDTLFSTAIELQELSKTIKKRTQCDRVIVFLDACNSGAAEAGGGKSLLRSSNFKISNIAGDGQIVISSSSANQRSWESKRYENGVFTRQLIKSLKSKGESTVLKDAFASLKDNVEQEVRFDRMVSQTPVMKMNWNGEEIALLSRPTRPRETPPYKLPTPKSSVNAVEEMVIEPLTKEPGMIGVIPFAGPLQCSIDPPPPSYTMLWGGMSSNDEVKDLNQRFTTSIREQVVKNKKFTDKLVPSGKLGLALTTLYKLKNASNIDTRLWTKNRWIEAGRKTGLSYLLAGEVDEAGWHNTTIAGKYTFIVSARLVDTNSGKIVAEVEKLKITKMPAFGDLTGGKNYFRKKIVPSTAKIVMKKLFKQLKAATAQ